MGHILETLRKTSSHIMKKFRFWLKSILIILIIILISFDEEKTKNFSFVLPISSVITDGTK